MITSYDKEYKVTKRIKQGRAQLAAPFDELANWISKTWSVTVLNVIYDPRDALFAPRIQVILEHPDHVQAFRDGCNFDREKQKAISAQFLEIINRLPSEEYDTDKLFVVFSAFSPIAREEADSKISEEEIDSLICQIANPDIWKISRCFGDVTFMFYTDSQADDYATKGRRAEYARKYFEILKPYDEFGYLSLDEFAVRFDSKQNFDENYESNWYYYYK